MSEYPTDPALEAAVVAHAEEDTPRLVYADWLDEHGDPDRAAFIRVQCRRADLSPHDPDWVDLTEQQDELVARLRHRVRLSDFPKPFYFGLEILGHREEPYRRGFPYFIDCQGTGLTGNAQDLNRVVADLTALVETTTLRGFHPYQIAPAGLGQLLAAPVAAKLTGLSLSPSSTSPNWEDDYTALYRLLAHGPSPARLQQLILSGAAPPQAMAELAASESLLALRKLILPHVDAPKAIRKRLVDAGWFQGLREFQVGSGRLGVGDIVIAGMGRLADLHSLVLPELGPKALAALASAPFPALGHLDYSGPFDTDALAALARAKFPALRVLSASPEARNDGLKGLLKADWFARLRVLNLHHNRIGDRGVAALSAHPVAKGLRALKLGENSFGKGGLTALAKPGAFPELTALNLGSHHKRKATPADLAAFLSALPMPRLRHLNLQSWPLGDGGAKALAANPTLANLTRLNVDWCGIGDAGADALFTSPHLQGLVELKMSGNPIVSGAGALADSAVMPRLAECWIARSKIPAGAKEKLNRPGLYLMI